MDKKPRSLRLTDEQYNAVRKFIKTGASLEKGYSSEEKAFIDIAIKWYRAQSLLKEIGVINVIPNPFIQGQVKNDNQNNGDRELKQNEFMLSRNCVFPDEILQDYTEYQQYEWVFARARQKLMDEHPDGICTYDDIRAMIDKYIKQVDN